ncbi:protein of unknown function [Amycolatopsis saalfeldensis]|uniref:Uncharacterized protein n=1 Tax=Amycolatopsis saalfeldensis TaxID=394193 RepID=A0A1H8WYI5_9PSEU|nr:protein of unknown function [Amycolatopsis saalfeldensis]
MVEGSRAGAPVVLAFPDLAWWDSPACREILPLRTDHLAGDVILVEGAAPDHDSAAPAARFRAAAA